MLPALDGVYRVFHVPEDDPSDSATPAYRAFTVQDYSTSERDEVGGADPLDVILVVASLGVLLGGGVAWGPGAPDGAWSWRWG